MNPFDATTHFLGDRLESISFPKAKNLRPLWKTLESLSPAVAVKWVDRFSVYESIAAEWALCMCYEKTFEIVVPERASAIRTLLLEFQRLLWSFNYVALVFQSIDDDFRKEQALHLREIMLGFQNIFTGSRVLPQALRIGGVERDVTIGEARKIVQMIDHCEGEFKYFFADTFEDHFFRNHLKGVLPLSKKFAAFFKLSGPLGQASGYLSDLRIEKPFGFYKGLNVKYLTSDPRKVRGDAYDRLEVVFASVNQSFSLIRALVDNLPEGHHFSGDFNPNQFSSGQCRSEIEGSSGKVFAYLSDTQIRISSPSVRMSPWLEKIFLGMPRETWRLGFASLGFQSMEGDLW